MILYLRIINSYIDAYACHEEPTNNPNFIDIEKDIILPAEIVDAEDNRVIDFFQDETGIPLPLGVNQVEMI